MIFTLLVVYQLKHFLADFPLQGQYMLGKFKGGTEWIKPLLAHVAVHGVFTLLICLVVNPNLWWLALIDSGIHFVMDRIKASPNLMGRWKALSGPEFVALEQKMKNANASFRKDFNVASVMGRADILKEYREKIRSNTLFWWALGIDQMVHHLTHYFIIWMLV